MTEVAIVGGGPSGLMAAEILASAGHSVTIYDRMPSLGRKFLLAGRGGLNLTHSEPLEGFLTRYGKAAAWLSPSVENFSPNDLRDWSLGLGIDTFIGSSGRVFPTSFKTSPLLRAWLRRLDGLGVTVKTEHRWTGWSEDGAFRFEAFDSVVDVKPAATILALGGASWARMGSDGAWVDILRNQGIVVNPLLPANCGFTIRWSEILKERFAGFALKRIALRMGDQTVRGEAIITQDGIEGGAVYALSAFIRDQVMAHGEAGIRIDLRADLSEAEITQKLSRIRAGDSFTNHLRKTLALPPQAIALLREVAPDVSQISAPALAALVKALPLRVTAVRGIDRAISTAGGVAREAFDDAFMLKQFPGVFCAGEMLDWEAPTGGYLLQACFSSGRSAAQSALRYLESKS